MSRSWSCSVALFALSAAAVVCGCSSSSPPIFVSVSPSSAAIDQGQTAQITASVMNGSFRGVSWSMTGPGSLSSESAYSVIYNSPQGNLTSAQKATITATSVTDNTKTASVQVTVNPYPQIPFQSLASGVVGTPYNQPITLIGGTPPFQWSVYNGPILTGWRDGGAVPDGLTLDSGTGAITGTPTGGGTWYFDAVLTDAAGVTVDNGFLSIQINSGTSTANPVPFLNQPVVPASVSPGSAGFTLNVSGTGFVSGATIDLNGSPLSTTFVDSGHLSASVPEADVAIPGTAAITVVNPPPGGGRSNFVYLQVGAPETTINFANGPNFPLQIPEPIALTTADFNEDGKPDLAIAANIRVYIMLGNGDGSFNSAGGSPFFVPSPPYDNFGSPYTGPVVAGDFNHSGHLGLAIGLVQNSAVATVFGNGDGTFTYSPTLANTHGGWVNSLPVADFNRDGNLDLVVVNVASGLSPVPLLGYSHGAFNQVVENVQLPGGTAAVGDFDADGRLDLAIDGANILLGNGDGSFTQGATAPAGGVATVAADFNGDGKLDLALAQAGTNTVTVLLGNGDGTFAIAPGPPAPIGSQPDAMIAGDFNNDGKLDLAIANYADGTLTILLGNGDGTFTEPAGSPLMVGQYPTSIAAADFNGDGKLDLAVVTSAGVSILLQQ